MGKHAHTDSHDCSHKHSHAHEHTHGSGTTRAIVWALVLNILFTVIEFIAGSYSNSTAVLSDAVHDLGDCFTIGFALVLQKFSTRRANGRFPFGYGRLSAASAFITSAVLIGGSLFMLAESVQRLLEAQHVIRTGIVIPLAVAGLLFNGVAARFLFHGHTHEGSHARRAIALHFIEDILGWAAVLAGSIIIWFTGWMWIDAALSVAISLFVLFQAARNMWKVIPIFFDTRPDTIKQEAAEKEAAAVFGNAFVSLHIWSIDGNRHAAIIRLHRSNTHTVQDLGSKKTQLLKALSSQQVYWLYFDLD